MIKYFLRLIVPLLLTLVFIFIDPVLESIPGESNAFTAFFRDNSRIFVILFLTLSLAMLVRGLKRLVLSRFDLQEEDNLRSRKVHTQINILEKVVLFIILLFGVGMILLSFEKIREIGVGLFASAGLAGIIIGLSAQRVVGALLAGLQIAFTQPFRIDDVVVVEGEFGWIEEINLTFVVVRLWDKRRLVLPSTYFLDNPFQNWTRSSADIIGSVFIHTDYSVPINALRQELDRLLENQELWDGKVKVLQVTDSKPGSIELRILVGASSAPEAWDLRVYVREQMVAFIQENYPSAFAKTRVLLKEDA